MLSIGIDVSKGKSTVCGMKPGGEIVYTPFEVQHTREGMSELVSLLRSSGEEVRAVLESTGSYHCPVVAALLENGIFVSVVNSLRMKRFCSQSIRKVKTDRIDAMQIALYGLAYWQELQPTKLPEDTYRELQLLARQYYQMTSLLIKAKVDFNAICDQVLPGMQELMNDHAGRHKLSDFVLRYHHTTHILEMGETRFRKDYCKWAEKKDTAIANVWQHTSLPQLKTVSLCFPMHHPRRSSLRKRYESSTQWRRPVTLGKPILIVVIHLHTGSKIDLVSRCASF